MAYYCGDEIDYGGGDELPGRVAEFRKFLAARYGTIDALNKQWDTRFASFDDIYPLTTQGETEPRAEKGKLVREKEYLEQAKVDGQLQPLDGPVAEQLQGVQRHGPRAARGSSGSSIRTRGWAWIVRCGRSPRCGHDWYTFLKEFEMFAPYGREGEIQPYEEARSFARPGTMLGLEYGGYLYNAFVRRRGADRRRVAALAGVDGLLRGFTSTWWYQSDAAGQRVQPQPGPAARIRRWSSTPATWPRSAAATTRSTAAPGATTARSPSTIRSPAG